MERPSCFLAEDPFPYQTHDDANRNTIVKPAIVQRVAIHPLAIPLRSPIHHAAAERTAADPVIIAIELTNGVTGFGEAVARPYVTGETAATVVTDIETIFTSRLLNFHPPTFPEALEAIEALPFQDSGRLITSARGAVELALLDATMRHFGRDVADIARWMGVPELGTPGSLPSIHFSGVLAAQRIAGLKRRLRVMYWGGLRHFKLKVGLPDDRERLAVIRSYLRRGLASGRCSLRADANGAWTVDQARRWLAEIGDAALDALEQPLARGAEDELSFLQQHSDIGLMHDESLITMEDAQRLIELGVADYFNIRISKCGGLLPSLRIAVTALRHDVGIMLGCMVGETSILSAAALRFLEVCPRVVWAEGLFGAFLLTDDIIRPSLRFGFGGRPPKGKGPGWGVQATDERLRALASDEPRVLHL